MTPPPSPSKLLSSSSSSSSSVIAAAKIADAAVTMSPKTVDKNNNNNNNNHPLPTLRDIVHHNSSSNCSSSTSTNSRNKKSDKEKQGGTITTTTITTTGCGNKKRPLSQSSIHTVFTTTTTTTNHHHKKMAVLLSSGGGGGGGDNNSSICSSSSSSGNDVIPAVESCTSSSSRTSSFKKDDDDNDNGVREKNAHQSIGNKNDHDEINSRIIDSSTSMICNKDNTKEAVVVSSKSLECTSITEERKEHEQVVEQVQGIIQPSSTSTTTTITKKQKKLFHIYCDLDGVLVDFEKGVKKLIGKVPSEVPPSILWSRIHRQNNFYEHLDWMTDGMILWEHIRLLYPTILTGVSSNHHSNQVAVCKFRWCQRELGMEVCHTNMAGPKQKHELVIDSNVVGSNTTTKPIHPNVINVITCWSRNKHYECNNHNKSFAIPPAVPSVASFFIPRRDPKTTMNQPKKIKTLTTTITSEKKEEKIQSVLIDDRIDLQKEWVKKGGIFVHHVNTQQTLIKLKELGILPSL